MDLSGLIFVGLALLWAVVLIPKTLRAHDEAARTRPVVATSGDARVLSRPGRAPTEPVSEQRRVTGPSGSPDSDGPGERPRDLATLVAHQRRSAAAAARRRRRVLGVLLLATALTGGFSAAGLLAPWTAAVPAALVAGFLVLARVLVRREHAAWTETLRLVRGTAVAEEAEAVVTGPEATLPEPELHVVARNDQGVAVVSDSEDTAAYDAAVLAQAVGAAAGSTLWDPLPVTLPTYVGKPRATRSVRTIDLAGPGVSNAGHDAADSALVAEAATAAGEQEPPAQRAVGS